MWGGEAGWDWEARQEANGFSELQNQFGHRVKQVSNVGCCVIRPPIQKPVKDLVLASWEKYPAWSWGDDN